MTGGGPSRDPGLGFRLGAITAGSRPQPPTGGRSWGQVPPLATHRVCTGGRSSPPKASHGDLWLEQKKKRPPCPCTHHRVAHAGQGGHHHRGPHRKPLVENLRTTEEAACPGDRQTRGHTKVLTEHLSWRTPTEISKGQMCPSGADKSASRKAETQQIAVRQLLYRVRHPDRDLGRLRRIRHLHLGASMGIDSTGHRGPFTPRRLRS